MALAIITAATNHLDTTGLPPAGPPRTVPPPSLRNHLFAMVAAALMVAATTIVAAAASVETTARDCQPITYFLESDLGPREAPDLIRSVFDELETLTGLRFVPADTQRDRSTPVRVAWVREPDTGSWNNGELGRATVQWNHQNGHATVRSGQILFRSLPDAGRIEAGPIDWHTLARHEIGHLLGLPHRSDPHSVMNPTLTPHDQGWTNQELAQLAAKGREAGCHSASRFSSGRIQLPLSHTTHAAGALSTSGGL